MKTLAQQIEEILSNHKIKPNTIQLIVAELEPLMPKPKTKGLLNVIRERLNPETNEPEIWCRDFEAWMPKEFGVFDKDGVYRYYSKLATKALSKYNKLKKENDEKVMALALDGEVSTARELKEGFAATFSEWVKTQNWLDYVTTKNEGDEPK